MYKDLTVSKKKVQKNPNNFETLLVKNPLKNYKKMSIFGSKIKINRKVAWDCCIVSSFQKDTVFTAEYWNNIGTGSERPRENQICGNSSGRK